MAELLAAIAVFTLFHALPSTPLRDLAVARFGRGGFMLAYSLVSLALFWWLFAAFFRADIALWGVTPPWFRWASAAVMLLAFLLLAASLLRPRPVLLTGETVLAEAGSVTGVLRLTRHPLLWALALWALVHVLNNPDPAGFALFGYFLLLALAGTWPIDRRRARLIGEARWQALLAATSNLPLLAVIEGRQELRLALREIGWPPLLVGVIAWASVLHFHAALFGLPIFY